MRELTNRINGLEASATMVVIETAARLRQAGKDVISFGAGEPDFDTPAPIIEDAYEAMLSGHTRYTPGAGTQALKEAVAGRMKRVNNLSYSVDQIVVSNGAKHSLFNAVMTLFQEGDEVLVLSPYWVTYPEVVKLSGARPVIVTTRVANGFQIEADDLEAAVSPRTAGIIVNTPSNPSGALLNRKSLGHVVTWAKRHDCWIIADECYESLVYEGEHVSLAGLTDAFERTVTLQTMSKTFAMTGWRMGFAAAPEPVASAMSRFQGQATGCPNSVAQHAAAFALNMDESFLEEWREAYRNRRDTMTRTLNDIPGIHCDRPAGAFYCFPDVTRLLGRKDPSGKLISTSADLANYLIGSAHVALVPGSAFGLEGYLRLSYATSLENVERGLARMRKAIEELN